MRRTDLFKIALIVFLIGDFAYSFLQYYHTPLFGDIEGGVVPSKDVQEIFNDPFGINAITSNVKHVNPNRFFSHLFLFEYFRNVPQFLQHFVEPIASVYLSSALIKLLIQVLIVYILSAIISNEKNILNINFLIVAALISPLLQTYGYWSCMGIIDKSVAYTFFYAVPLVLLMLYLKPFYNKLYNGDNKPWGAKLLFLIPLTFILPLSGPLMPGVILIFSALLFLWYIVDYRKRNGATLFHSLLGLKAIPKSILLLIVPICLVSLYSLFLGFYDSNYVADSIPLVDRYLKLPGGIFSQLTHSLGLPLLLVIIGVNLSIIHKKFNDLEGKKIMNIVRWIGIFSVIYLLLLPLGGYRPYRPNIVRYDTTMPISIGLFYAFGASTYYLFRKIKSIKYWSFIVVSMLIYTFSDISKLEENKCEVQALNDISNSPDSIVKIPCDCYIMSWEKMSDYKRSGRISDMLLIWNITKEKKLFYQE